jgi:hypothetical protein
VPSPAHGAQKRGYIDGARARAGRDEDAVLHRHHLQQDLAVEQIHHLMGDDAQTVDIADHGEGHHVDVLTSDMFHAHRVDHVQQHPPLFRRERIVQVALYERR